MARPAKFDDETVLDRAMHLFWRRGCRTATIRDLEVELELRAPSIYRRFGSKDQLIARCLRHYIDTVIAGRIANELGVSENPLADLHSFFLSSFGGGQPHRESSGCLLTNTATEVPTLPAEVGDLVAEGVELIRLAFHREIHRAVALGLVPDNIDTDQAAHRLLLELQGLLLLTRSGEDPSDLARRVAAVFPSEGPEFVGGGQAGSMP